jgi:hypothetical protein
MILVKIVTEEIAKEILEKYLPKEKDFLICQSIDKIPSYIHKQLNRNFFIINSQEPYYNKDFLIIPEGYIKFDELEINIENVDLVISNVKSIEEISNSFTEKDEFESYKDYLARCKRHAEEIELSLLLLNAKERVKITNKIQFIKTKSNTSEYDDASIFE